MKRAGLILAAVGLLIVGALGGMLYWAFQQMEQNKNKDKTEAARKARWSRKEGPPGDEENGEMILEMPESEPAKTANA